MDLHDLLSEIFSEGVIEGTGAVIAIGFLLTFIFGASIKMILEALILMI